MKYEVIATLPFTPHPFVSDFRNLNHIRHALLADRHGSEVNDEVAVFDEVVFLEEESNIGDSLIGAHHFIIEEGMHTPNEIHLCKNFFVAREDEDIGVGAPARNTITRVAAKRHGN